MFSTYEEFMTGAREATVMFDEFAQRHFTRAEAVADHICYKCGSAQEFESIRAILERTSAFIYQSIISNRRISYSKFREPLQSALGSIWFLELSDQKPDRSQSAGFDHIEVYPSLLSYDAMIDRLREHSEVIHVARPHHTTDDVKLSNGFIFRCTQGPLLQKIVAEEMRG